VTAEYGTPTAAGGEREATGGKREAAGGRALADWSARRIILASVLWLVGAPLLAAVGLVLAGLLVAAISGDQRIGFTARLSNWSLAWFYLPPLVLVGAWLWARGRKRQ
jgi:hypothetical protein